MADPRTGIDLDATSSPGSGEELTVTCVGCGASNPRRSRFCADCGTALDAGPVAPARETRKLVTILFADVAGSTELGEQLDPETVRSMMHRYFAVMKRIIEAHGGTVEKFIGDAVMAVFGIPVVHEDDALRAVRAADAIRAELAGFDAGTGAGGAVAIRFRTGINTGEVVAGDSAGGETMVTGDPVNTAARLEAAAAPGEILLGRLTWQLVRDAVTVEAIEPLSAKGKADPLPAFRLLALDPDLVGRVRRLDTPLVGREREMAALHNAFERVASERSCQLFTLLGTAGVGKSRLVAEFTTVVEADAAVLRGRCLSYGEGITYWPVGEIVRAAARIEESDTAETARLKLRAILAGERDVDVVTARVASAIGLSVEVAPQEEVFWAIRKLLEHLARQRPLVVVIEDIHWAEPTLLDLIEHVADWSRDAPILLLCPARPELLDARAGWSGGKLNATNVLLEPLGAEATGRLIAALPGGHAIPAAVEARVAAAAEGNPLYVEELLGMLVDDGLLVQAGDDTWSASDGPGGGPHPRLDQRPCHRPAGAPGSERAGGRRAGERRRPGVRAGGGRGTGERRSAARGRALAAGARAQGAGPARPLRADRGRRLQVPPHPHPRRGLRGASEVGAGRPPRALRGLARADGRRAPGRVRGDRRLPPRSGTPLPDRARRDRRPQSPRWPGGPGTRLAAAGGRAFDRGDMAAAAALLGRASAAFPVGSTSRLRLLPDVGYALFGLGRITDAHEVLGSAIQEATAAGESVLAIHAQLERATITILSTSDASQRSVALAALPMLESIGDDLGLARAYLVLAGASWMSGQVEAARRGPSACL